MSWKEAIAGALQSIQLVVTIVLAVLGFQLNREAELSKQTISRIETNLKVKQDDRAAIEAGEKLRFQLFTEVSKSLEKGNPQQQQAAQALVTALLEDGDDLRKGLLLALSVGAAPSVKQEFQRVVDQEIAYADQQEESLRAATVAAATAVTTGPSYKPYFVDVFYCEKDGETLKPRAQELVTFLQSRTARSRLRLLAESLNASPGMRVSGLQLRYNSDELRVAQDLKRDLAQGKQGDFTLKQIKSPTANYLSVFVCA